jgi:sugar diacid utilization regulator
VALATERMERAVPVGPLPRPLPERLVDCRATAARAGRVVADAYWPCLVSWTVGEATVELIHAMERMVARWDRRNLVVSLGRLTQLLLLATKDGPVADRRGVATAASSVIDASRLDRPEARLHVVVGEPIRPDERLVGVAAHLRDADRHGPATGTARVVWVRRQELRRLLNTLDARAVLCFVEQQLAPLATYDQEHGTNLQHVLELALDHADRSTAARAAFMHRNTFRRQVGKALELLDVDLDEPEERFAIHLALKMRSLASSAAPGWCAVHRPD